MLYAELHVGAGGPPCAEGGTLTFSRTRRGAASDWVAIMKRTSAIFASILLAPIVTATADPMSVQPAPLHAQAELICHRCPNGYVWVPDGTISGPTAGYPYFGWYGYPYIPYRCVRLHFRHYGHDQQL
jgi:hypothetical protein